MKDRNRKAKPDAPAEKPVPGRLHDRSQFLAVREGEKRRGPLFLLEVRKTRDGSEPPRVGYTVTKKSGNAVERNRIRRRLKEAVRQHAGRDMAGGTDYVIVGRAEVLGAGFADLVEELRRRIRMTEGERRNRGKRIDGKQP